METIAIAVIVCVCVYLIFADVCNTVRYCNYHPDREKELLKEIDKLECLLEHLELEEDVVWEVFISCDNVLLDTFIRKIGVTLMKIEEERAREDNPEEYNTKLDIQRAKLLVLQRNVGALLEGKQ